MQKIDTPPGAPQGIPSMTGRDWHHANCYGCGLDNPKGLQADFRFDLEHGEVRFDYQGTADFEGAPGFFHGGVLATILDEAQGVLCFHVGHSVMTEKLHMNYHKATPLHSNIKVRAWLTAVRKRRLYTRAVIYNEEEEIYVSSSASWYVLPDRLMRKMFQNRFSNDESERVKSILDANRKRAKETVVIQQCSGVAAANGSCFYGSAVLAV